MGERPYGNAQKKDLKLRSGHWKKGLAFLSNGCVDTDRTSKGRRALTYRLKK